MLILGRSQSCQFIILKKKSSLDDWPLFGHEALDMLFLGLRGAHSLPSAAGQADQTVYNRTVVEKFQQTGGIGSGEAIQRVDIGTDR